MSLAPARSCDVPSGYHLRAVADPEQVLKSAEQCWVQLVGASQQSRDSREGRRIGSLQNGVTRENPCRVEVPWRYFHAVQNFLRLVDLAGCLK